MYVPINYRTVYLFEQYASVEGFGPNASPENMSFSPKEASASSFCNVVICGTLIKWSEQTCFISSLCPQLLDVGTSCKAGSSLDIKAERANPFSKWLPDKAETI